MGLATSVNSGLVVTGRLARAAGWWQRATRCLVAAATMALGIVGAIRAQTEATNPHGTLALPCASCHSAAGWKPAKIQPSFRHADFGFPLQNAHAGVTCASCHKSLEFGKVSQTCASCHRDVHRGELGLDCAQCHNDRAFTDRSAFVQRHSITRFPLAGAHRAVDCAQCHTGRSEGALVFRGAPTTCISCHRGDFERATNPKHSAAKFSSTCTDCHTDVNWLGATFDHSVTQFPLTGGHRAATCQACHADGVYTGKPMTCVSCHQGAYDQTKAPPHQAAGFPRDCTVCHTTATWTGAQFDHDTRTRFPLTGGHRAVSCQSCHADGIYVGKSTACASCHQPDFARTTNPPHQAAGFGSTCTDCHTTTAWKGARFDHNATQFPLTGAHQAATCQSCHADGVYRGKPTACLACHQPDFTATTSPPHQAAGFPTTCTTCHNTVTWTGASFDHNTSQFPLTGAHQAATCQSCHGDGVYQGKPTTCVSCHQADYNKTANPSHQTAGFSTTCMTCHTTTTWAGAVFNHNNTQFPLTGAHLATTCQACHADGVFKGKPTACVACHQTDFNGTTNPPHQAAGFPTTCTDCHTTTTWTGSAFNHSNTQFPLTGAHLAATCQSCHADGVYKGKPTACVTCHQTDYNGTTNPPHQAAGFSTTCATCHTTTVWTGAVFNHSNTQFPLTGAHVAATCQACHADGVYKGKPTTCISCHQTDYTGTTNPNHQAAQFPTTCASCHTTTQWLGATFDHDGPFFPIYSGTHRGRWNTCSDCHTNAANYAVFTCLSCHPHSDKAKTDADHRGEAGYQYASQACYSCHPRGTH